METRTTRGVTGRKGEMIFTNITLVRSDGPVCQWNPTADNLLSGMTQCGAIITMVAVTRPGKILRASIKRIKKYVRTNDPIIYIYSIPTSTPLNFMSGDLDQFKPWLSPVLRRIIAECRERNIIDLGKKYKNAMSDKALEIDVGGIDSLDYF